MKRLIFLILVFIVMAFFLRASSDASRPPTPFHKVKGKSLGRLTVEQKRFELWNQQQKSKVIGAMAYLWAEVSIRKPIRVLDAGTGEGWALKRLEDLFKWMEYQDVTVEGLDDLSKYRGGIKMPKKLVDGHVAGVDHKWAYIYTDQEERDYKDEKSLEKAIEIEERTGYRMWWLKIQRAHLFIPHKFDFIFASSMPSDSESIKNFAEGSFKLLKDTGVIFWRFPQGRTTLDNVNELRKWIQEHNYYVVMRSDKGILPDGYWEGDVDGESYVDGHMTFIIKKRFWDSKEEGRADSLGKMADTVFDFILKKRMFEEAA